MTTISPLHPHHPQHPRPRPAPIDPSPDALPTAADEAICPPRGCLNWRERFRRFASWTANAAGSPWTSLMAALFLILWVLSYPLFLRFSDPFDTWQLVVNTVTTIVTFLMVFLIQNTQNRDAKAIHLKLDELIRANKRARNRLVELENCTDEELETLKKEFEKIRERSERERAQRESQMPSPRANVR